MALLRPAEQSSTFADRMASLAVDGNLDSCSSTEDKNSGDSQRFWSVQLQTAVNIKEVWVTLNHGVAFHQEFTVFVIGTFIP